MHVRCILPPKAGNNLAEDFNGKEYPPPNEDVLFQFFVTHTGHSFITPFSLFYWGREYNVFLFFYMGSFKFLTKCICARQKQDIMIDIPFLCG